MFRRRAMPALFTPEAACATQRHISILRRFIIEPLMPAEPIAAAIQALMLRF